MPFADIVGHHALTTLLRRAIARDALPPSLLFDGPVGVGKSAVALALAQALNCVQRRQRDVGGGNASTPPGSAAPDSAAHLDACGRCASCVRIQRGVHPDVIRVSPGDTGAIKVDAVRDVVERSAYRPYEGRRRVVIIDDADALLVAAQNAMLKTLEEPPSASVFVLVTAHPDLLLPTVRSRCPRLRFQPLSADEVATVLERRGMASAEARALAVAADGSVTRADEAADTDLVEGRDTALRVLAAATRAGEAGRLDLAKTLLANAGGGGAKDRDALAVYLRIMSSLLRDVELIGAGGAASALANRDAEGALRQLAGYQGERGLTAFRALDRGLMALERNASPKIVADWVMLQL